MSGDPLVRWMRRELLREYAMSIAVGVVAVAVLALFIAGLAAIA